MTSDKIAIVLDSNMLMKNLKEREALNTFSLNLYDDTVDMVERNDLVEKISIFIPEIVFFELCKHRLDKLADRINHLKNLADELKDINDIAITLKDSFDIKKHAEDLRKTKLEEIEIIRIPEDKSALFEKILSMSINKIPPFEEEASDKGFKDAILLLSVIDFAKNSNYTKFVLFSKDGAFVRNAKTIQATFKVITSKELEIQDNKDIQGYISNNYDLFMEFKKYLNEHVYPKIDELIKKKKSIVLKDKRLVCEIKEFVIDDENTILEEVSEDEFNLRIAFRIMCTDNIGNTLVIDDVQKQYHFVKEPDKWREEAEDFNYLVY